MTRTTGHWTRVVTDHGDLGSSITHLETMRPIVLTCRYLKDRSVSDYTFSQHADGWDDAMHDVEQQLKAAGVPYTVRDATAEELEGME